MSDRDITPKWPRVRVHVESVPTPSGEPSKLSRASLSTIGPNGNKFGCTQQFTGIGLDTKNAAIERASEELNKRMQIEFPDQSKLTLGEINNLLGLCELNGLLGTDVIVSKLHLMKANTRV